jgi:2-deoxy-D-gluconate 3-dehydrogenase
VTGSSSGIGKAIAIALAQAGATVGLNGTRREALEATRAEIEQNGGTAVVLPADIGDIANCRRLIEDAATTLGGIDILVNNAGINRRKPILEVTDDDFEAILNVNLRSALFLGQAAQSHIKARGGGKIVNIGSMTSYIGLGSVSVYGVTKAGIAQLTQTMAVEWAPDNIQVNCLAPGFIRTPLNERAVWSDERRSRWILERVPARRPGVPADLIGTALLLCSPASDYLTGQIIAVDGGFLAGGSWDAGPV